MIIWLSRKLADAMVGAGAAREQDREVYEYGLEVLISTAASVACVIAAGVLLGKAAETIAFLIVFIALRSAAGGFHASTHFRCFLVMMAAYAASMALLFSVPQGILKWVAVSAAALACAVVAIYAPAPHENRPVGDGELRRFRALSLWIAGAEAIAVAVLSLLGFVHVAFGASLGMAASSVSLVVAHMAANRKKRLA